MNPDRSYVICHMMITLDGKITYGNVQGKDPQISVFGDYMDLYNSTHEKLESNAWICGRKTMQEFTQESGTSLDEFKADDIDNEDYILKKDLNNYAVGIDTQGLLRWNENFLYIGTEKIDSNTFNLVTIVTTETPKQYLSYLKSKNISYIFAGEKVVNFKEVFTKLKSKFGIERILLEGGGSINGSVIDEELIDEISLLILPKVINNIEAPALFYKELEVPKLHEFKLTSVEKLDKDVVWLRYEN